VEPTLPAATREALASFCHPIKVFPAIGAVSAAGLVAGGVPKAAGDPRKDGGAVVVR
jgi:hypothetical protein